MSFGFQMQPKGGRARLRARPPFRYAFYSQNPQKCLRGGFFEGFRGPREGFLRVFQNFRGRRRVFLGFFEGFLDPDVKIWRSKGLNPSLYTIFHGDFEKKH